MKTIFVSSTFKDMQFERDAIQNIITPKLNIVARQYGDEVSFCDLRWGVDTSELENEVGSKKVLDVCLDEIDRCEPPMIVILGDRYGWIPSEELVKDTAKLKQLQLDHLRKSVTALEIEYGAFSRNTLFYYREIENEAPLDLLSEDEEHLELLNQLKEKITTISGQNVKTYHITCDESGNYQLENFVEMVSADVQNILMEQWLAFEKKTPFEKESYKHEVYAKQKASIFKSRNQLVLTCLDSIQKNTYTFIKGAVGSGKSSLFSHLYEKLSGDIFIRFCSLTDKSDTATELLEQMIYYLENLMEVSHKDMREEDFTSKKKIQYFESLCHEYDSLSKKCYFMIDAVDQLTESQIKEDLLFIPKGHFENIRFIVTAINDFSFGMRNYISVEDLNDIEKKDIIQGILSSYNKELSSAVIEAMIQEEMTKNPLYISFIIQRLTMMNQEDFKKIRLLGDGMDAIITHQLDLIHSCPKSLREMSVEVLRVAGEHINPTLINQVVSLIAISRYGLRTSDLHGMIGESFNTLDFSHFVSFMKNNFIKRENGCYDFSHKSIREGYFLSMNKKKEKFLHSQISNYFLSLENDDPISTNEVGYHLLMAEDYLKFVEYVEKYMYVEDLTRITQCAKCTRYIALMSDEHWLSRVIENCGQYASNNALTSFLNFDLWYTLKNTDKEKSFYYLALVESLKLLNQIYPNDLTSRIKLVKHITLVRLGDYAVDDNISYTYYCEALVIINNLLEEKYIISYRVRKAELLHKLAKCNITGGNLQAIFDQNKFYEKAIAILEEVVQEKPTINYYEKLAYVYDSFINYCKIGIFSYGTRVTKEYLEELHQKLIICNEKIMELDNDGSVASYHYMDLAKSKVQLSDFDADEVIYLMNKAIIIDKHKMQEYPTVKNYYFYADTLYRVGRIYALMDDWLYNQEAIAHFQLAIEVVDEILKRNFHKDYLLTKYWSLIRIGDMEAIFDTYLGIEYYQKAKVFHDKYNLKNNSVHNRLGDIYTILKEPQLAKTYYQEAEKIDSKGMGNVYAEVREVLSALGEAAKNKIPKETLDIIEDCYNRLYQVPFKGEEWTTAKLLEDTKVMLSMFYVQFLSSDKEREAYIQELKDKE